MTTTTDDVTHLRALLAEQTARAERAEALLVEARATMLESNANALRAQHDATDGDQRWAREQARIAKERDAALAANAEMRAALESAREVMTGMIGQEWADAWNAADAALSRPDLGAGKVLVARDVVERVRRMFDLLRETTTDRTRAEQMAEEARALNLAGIIADLDAALKKGGG